MEQVWCVCWWVAGGGGRGRATEAEAETLTLAPTLTLPLALTPTPNQGVPSEDETHKGFAAEGGDRPLGRLPPG